jgi:opacity protein-like surface antigen
MANYELKQFVTNASTGAQDTTTFKKKSSTKFTPSILAGFRYFFDNGVFIDLGGSYDFKTKVKVSEDWKTRGVTSVKVSGWKVRLAVAYKF